MALTLFDKVMALPSVTYADRRAKLPDKPGLYFAIRPDSEVLYIGMSRKSIRARWKTWHQAACEIEKRKMESEVRIAYIVYASIDAVAADERSIIRELRPTFNMGHVPGALERQQQRSAEECKWVDCEEHDHTRWPPREVPTEVRPCYCIVHRSCAERDGERFAQQRAAEPPSP